MSTFNRGVSTLHVMHPSPLALVRLKRALPQFHRGYAGNVVSRHILIACPLTSICIHEYIYTFIHIYICAANFVTYLHIYIYTHTRIYIYICAH